MAKVKRTIPQINILLEDVQKFYSILNNESDISVILMTASYLDALLGSVLHRFLINSSITDKLLEGALGTLSARADLCYSLGFIGKKIYQDICLIGQIRNMVAHHYLIGNFEDEKIVELCNELSYAESLLDAINGQPLYKPELQVTTRMQFVLTAVTVSQVLLTAAMNIKQRKAVVDRFV